MDYIIPPLVIIICAITFYWGYCRATNPFGDCNLERDAPFCADWLRKTPEERNKIWAEMVERTKAEWEHRRATMTDDEIEEKYKVLYVYPNEKARIKRKEQERKILESRINNG